MHSMHLMHIYKIFYSLSTRIYDELTQYFKLVLDYSTRQGTRLENYFCGANVGAVVKCIKLRRIARAC